MPAILAIPADVVVRLRGALIHQLRGVAEDFDSANDDPTPEQLREWAVLLARFDRTRALLELVGYAPREPERDVKIDATRHRWALVKALGDDLESERWTIEGNGLSTPQERERARSHAEIIEAFAESAGLDLDSEPGEPCGELVTVPAGFVELLEQSALTSLMDAAGRVEDLGLAREHYPATLAEFDLYRGLAEAIGGQLQPGEDTAISIDVAVHGEALRKVLAEALDLERSMAQADPKGEASGNVAAIEAFVQDADLKVGG